LIEAWLSLPCIAITKSLREGTHYWPFLTFIALVRSCRLLCIGHIVINVANLYNYADDIMSSDKSILLAYSQSLMCVHVDLVPWAGNNYYSVFSSLSILGHYHYISRAQSIREVAYIIIMLYTLKVIQFLNIMCCEHVSLCLKRCSLCLLVLSFWLDDELTRCGVYIYNVSLIQHWFKRRSIFELLLHNSCMEHNIHLDLSLISARQRPKWCQCWSTSENSYYSYYSTKNLVIHSFYKIQLFIYIS